ncbi:MAG: hypothetical protein IJP68_08245, partial [Selenomonadaceae bacterium]|nr:hypothetical protein [Selenomonadaceae bacterium]
EMEMVQIKGVDSTVRTTKSELAKGAKLVVRERLMTHGNQHAEELHKRELEQVGTRQRLFHAEEPRITS